MKFIKPNFWDKKKPDLLAYLLLPFTILIRISNYFNDKKSNIKIKDIKTICVGNIYIGGTSKTPTTIKIYQILTRLGFKVSTIKKFYKNQTDEQNMLRKKTNVIISKNRIEGTEKALRNGSKVAIFDDGLQDRNMDYDLKFLCFNSEKWIGNGLLIPAGPLREKLESIKKYDLIFLNGKCENIKDIKKKIHEANPSINIFETYFNPINLDSFDRSKNYLIFSGIGNPDSFSEILKKNNFNIIKEIRYPDHYDYTIQDIKKIKSIAKKLNLKIVTTEKDFTKIALLDDSYIKFLQVELIIKEEEKFVNLLKKLNEKY